MPAPLKVLVVGAGIAGCAVAIALADQGAEVTLIEKQAVWRFQSSGIFVYGNGLESFEHLGVLPGLLAAGFAIDDGRNVYLDHAGRPIVDVFYPRPSDAIPPILGIKRAEIHRVLAGRLQTLGVDIRLGTTLDRIHASAPGAGVRATLSDGGAAVYDLVIGADGIRSQLRADVLGDNAPRYSGFGVWRSVHARPPGLTAKIMMMGVGKRLGIMPISDDKLYIFGTVAEPAGVRYAPAQWAGLMRARFAEFEGPARPFLDELDPASEVLYTAVEEVVAPLPWHAGRVVLIGDAVHASTPFMGQGGAMAVEDAVVLARLLAQAPSIDDALAAFGPSRHAMCKFVQDASRRVGEAGAEEDAARCVLRDQALRSSAQAQVDGFYGQLKALRAGQ